MTFCTLFYNIIEAFKIIANIQHKHRRERGEVSSYLKKKSGGGGMSRVGNKMMEQGPAGESGGRSPLKAEGFLKSKSS